MKYGWNIENELTFGELSRDFYYANLLVDNIMGENLHEVRSLLETKKANPNTVMPELGVAPLHLLAGLENENFSSTVMLQAILRSGGDPNVRSEDGLTPVHVAAMWGRCKVLDILLANGGDPELIDYKMFLNAEEYAIREQQWKAYGVLSTFSVMEDGGHKTIEQNENNMSGNEKTSPPNINRELKNKYLLKLKDTATNDSDCSSIKDGGNDCRYSTIRKKKKSKRINQTDDESHSDRSDWTNTMKLNLNSALNAIKRPSARKGIKDLKKNQTDDESLTDRSDRSKCTIKSLNLKALSAIKRKCSARKGKKGIKMNQTHDQSFQSDQSDLSKSSRKPLQLEDGVQRTIERRTMNTNKIDNTSQTCNELNSNRSDKSRSTGTIESIKLNDGALNTIRSLRRKTNIYESLGATSDKTHHKNKFADKNPKEKASKLSLYGDSVSESYDWIRKSGSFIKLDEKALSAIKNRRLSSKIYQTKGLGEDPLIEREKTPPLYEESEVCDWVDPRNRETFDEPSLNKISIHRKRTATFKSEDVEYPPMMFPGPKLPRRNRRMHHKRKEDSEMYLCGYAEESVGTNGDRRQQYLPSSLSDVTSSDFDERGVPNQRMLCKMSRMFLFMLKKRHTYKR